ncbi:hypothetical protein SKAU_G00410940 [Synaphobranchus kaupii]|uniref:Uncharacterized protein n=1 Tax=Synaphobranchus kaupii TaxID=118154 RepID=A0A9Q1E7S5_SYNKA|nr:hypothetical protein SKAU_G00410940 [Synaphobranchus kaupii]
MGLCPAYETRVITCWRPDPSDSQTMWATVLEVQKRGQRHGDGPSFQGGGEREALELNPDCGRGYDWGPRARDMSLPMISFTVTKREQTQRLEFMKPCGSGKFFRLE